MESSLQQPVAKIRSNRNFVLPKPQRLFSRRMLVAFLVTIAAVSQPASADTTKHNGAEPATPLQANPYTSQSGLLSASRTVTVSSQSTFSIDPGATMIILEDVPAGAELRLRSRNGEEWSDVTHLASEDHEGPDSTDEPDTNNIGPIWVGDNAELVELTTRHSPVSVTMTSLGPQNLGLATPNPTRSTPQVRSAQLNSPLPLVQPRQAWTSSGWATGNSGCEKGPRYSDGVKAMVLHHTASTNNYQASQVPQILRGIYHLHVNINKWCDVGYNFIVDKFGTVWEARSGGITKAVIGGHAKGFNTNTTGIALLGQHQPGQSTAVGTPTAAAQNAIVALAQWKLSIHNVDPKGTTTLRNRSSSGAQKHASGEDHILPTILGHRDLGLTSCPGSHSLPFLRSLSQRLRYDPTDTDDLNAYINGIASVLTGEDADIAQDWVDQFLVLGRQKGADRFSFSDQAIGPQIESLYNHALDRETDPTGIAMWTTEVQNGLRYADLAASVYGSQEYYNHSGTDAAYVESLYRKILDRESDPIGKTNWVTLLESKTVSRSAVAFNFIQALETRQKRVHAQYLRILGRTADPQGLASWADHLFVSDDFVLASLLIQSEEFYNKTIG